MCIIILHIKMYTYTNKNNLYFMNLINKTADKMDNIITSHKPA